MPALSLALLGQVSITLDERPLSRMPTKGAQALLVTLACRPEVHHRESLMTLLWPAKSAHLAQTSLRQALYLLKKEIPHLYAAAGNGEVSLLRADRQTVQINPDGNYELDVARFTQLVACLPLASQPLSSQAVESLRTAVALYRGDFLADFTLPDSAPFEEWVTVLRVTLRGQALEALEVLAENALSSGDYDSAEQFARRQLEIDNLREAAHRQLMRLLAENGRRVEATAHYAAYRRLLRRELGIDPGAELVAFGESIRAGRVRPPLPMRGTLPDFLGEENEPRLETSPFVARERELDSLDGQLRLAQNAQGKAFFVTGEAGSGKTSLLNAFANRAVQNHRELIVAWGRCGGYTGGGDPYLPFREVIGMLTGDIEAHVHAGAISLEHGRRLWSFTPQAIEALYYHAPDLAGLLLPGRPLVARAELAVSGASWLADLRQAALRPKPALGDREQGQLLSMISDVLLALARERPLLLLLDDLQWVDTASADLLFHLARRLAGSRILILGAYRPDEVALGREERRHPLQPVLNELQRLSGQNRLDLDQVTAVEGQNFINALLGSQPNRLDGDFRRLLFGRTGGNPLFTVELMRAMRERGDLLIDEQGYTVAGPTLDWDQLPAQVEGVLKERIERLDAPLRLILQVACVEGEDFTAQTVAQVLGVPERDLLLQLNDELLKRHRLIAARGRRRLSDLRLSRFGFRHNLFQQYLYHSLSEAERIYLHEDVGNALETLYGDQAHLMAGRLGHHFYEAGREKKAINYLLEAGDQARLFYSHQEAIDYYQLALSLLERESDDDRAARTYMKVGLTHHNAYDFKRARRAYEQGFLLWQRIGRLELTVPPPPAPHAFRATINRASLSLDPAKVRGNHEVMILDHLFSGLVHQSPELDIVPDVAHSWEVLDGGRTYIFHLRDDASWSDGMPLTAVDFEYAWKRVLNPATESYDAGLLYDIKGAKAYHEGKTGVDNVGVTALDGVTLRVELEGPSGYFLHLPALAPCYPVPRHLVQQLGDSWAEADNIVTCGPFELQVWQPGRLMTFSRSEFYHGRFQGNLQRVELLILEDASSGLEIYEAGILDVLEFLNLPPDMRDQARRRHAGEYVSATWMETDYLGFDVSRAPFDDIRVRQAFALAVDRELLAEVATGGDEFPATGGFVPPGMSGHAADVGTPYDPQRARYLLEKAGYPQGRGFPELALLAPEFAARTCQSLLAQWQEVLGVEIKPRTLEYEKFWHALGEDRPAFFVLGWVVDFPDPDNILRSGVPRQTTGWFNKSFEDLVDRARRIMDQSRRMALYRQAEKILVEDAAISPLTYGRAHLLVKPWLRRFPISPFGRYSWKDIILEAH